MAYIYKIKNTENNMLYVGKTQYTIDRRFKSHVSDSKNIYRKHRKLYRAMNKFGADKFSIELIEEVSDDIASDREIYWINKLDTYKNGYNSTLGGEGKSTVDYDMVVDTYLEMQCISDVAWKLDVDMGTIKKVLESRNIPIKSNREVQKDKYGIAVNMHDKVTKKIIKTFDTRHDAATYMIENGKTNCKHSTIRTHIKQVCDGKRKSAGGYFWSNVV